MLNRIKKYILCVIVLFVPLLLSYSYAVPDFYFHDNFITGMSPFSVPTSLELDANGYWEDYSPIQDNLGFVTSYDNTFMVGSTPPSAVPSYDLDLLIGKNSYLQPGEAVVLYSSSGQLAQGPNFSFSPNSKMFALTLGTTAPTNMNIASTYNNLGPLAFGSNALFDNTSSNTLAEVPYLWRNTNLPTDSYIKGISSEYGSVFATNRGTAYSPYKYSFVILLINYGDTEAYIYPSSYGGERFDLPSIPYNDISWDIVTSNTYINTETSSNQNYLYLIPHVNGDFDMYSFVHSNDENSVYYTFLSNYDFKIDIDFDNPVVYNGSYTFFDVTLSSDVKGYSSDRKVYYATQLTNLPASSGLVPIFIHQYNATRYINGKAVYIYDGYLSIQNYDELVALLKQNGVGQLDLTRVTQLLEEINSGGEKGEEVSELIGILEEYHNQLQNQANFDSATGVFDTYKNILEFSSDMHWLITANNSLFEYFAGFIMMCAMFLFLGRIMR